MDLAEKLLVLADSAAGDGAQGLVRALRTVLAEIAPFDAGEAVLVSGERFLRWRLDDHEGDLLGADVVRHIGALHAPLRFDDQDDAKAFPETHQALVAQGMRSLLVLPFQGGGALAVARRYGWAFVGASMHHLWPVRGMAGIALRQAVLLTGLAQKVEAQQEDLERANATPDELRVRLERAEARVREREGQRAAANAGWESTRAELRETARSLAAAVAGAASAREGEERAEAKAADLQRRLSEETGKREATEADAQRRQAEADEKLGRADGERQALAVEVEALRREERHAQGEARDEAERLRGESERWRVAAEEARPRVARAEAELAEARGETKRARAETEDAHTRAAALREELSASRREAEDLRTRLDTDLPALEAEKRVLTSELKTARDETARLLHAVQPETPPKAPVGKRRRGR